MANNPLLTTSGPIATLPEDLVINFDILGHTFSQTCQEDVGK